MDVLLVVLFRMIGPEGRHFDDLATKVDVHELEPTTDHARIAKLGAYLFWRGTGCDVEILGNDAQHEVAYATAYQIGLIARRLQAFDDAHGMSAELAALQRMLPSIEHFGRGTPVLRMTRGSIQRLEQLLQHGMHCLKEFSAIYEERPHDGRGF